MYIGIEYDKGKSVLQEAKESSETLNIYKFYSANVPLSLFHAAMRMYDCVTFYLILCFLATCMRQINFFIQQKKVSWGEKKESKRKFFHKVS